MDDFQIRENVKAMKRLNFFFESIGDIPRVKHGNKQTLETLVNEEALLLANYLRSERHLWIPRAGITV